MTEQTHGDRLKTAISPVPVSRRQFLRDLADLATTGTLLLTVPPLLQARQFGGPLRIGVMGPFTGPHSNTGNSFKKGILMALEDARAAGEIPVTIEGEKRNLEVVWIDSQSSSEQAVEAVTDAVKQQGVAFIVSGWHSSVAMAVMDVVAALNVVHIGHNGESQHIAEKMNQDPQKYKVWFKGWPSPTIFAGLYGEPLQYFIEQGLWRPATRKAAVLVEDTPFGRSWGEALLGSLQSMGFTLQAYDVAALDEMDFTSKIAKYKTQQVSVVGMTSTGSVCVSNFVRQFRDQGVRALLIGHGLTWFKEWYELTGNASNYVITMDSPRPIAPYQQSWIVRYRAKYGEEPSLVAAGHAYDYLRLAVKILNRAATLDTDRLVDVGRNIGYQGVWHYYKFAKEPGPQALAPNEIMTGGFEQGFFFPMVQLMKGKTPIVWPLNHAEKPFEQPPWIQ